MTMDANTIHKKLRALTWRIVLCWVLFAILCLFTCFLLFLDDEGLEAYFGSLLVSSEAMYLLLGMCICFLAAMVVFTRSAVYTARRLRAIERAWAKKERRERKARKAIRFTMLDAIDRECSFPEPDSVYNNVIDLEALCTRFRAYAASVHELYYSIEDVRRFVAGMGVSKLLILEGMSGTGKTSLAYAFGEFLQNPAVVTPVQPMWKERSDMIGYFNEFTGRFNETMLLRKMYEAGYRRDMYITILDEVNISRVEYYFAEFLSLLELPDKNKRLLDVVADVWPNDPAMLQKGRVRLPANMWFIGTANNDDSTFAISDKVYDRAMILSLNRKCEPFEAEEAQPIRLSADYFEHLIDKAKYMTRLSEDGERKVAKLDAYLQKAFGFSFGNRIMKQLREYAPILRACGGTENEAIDDILVRKVLRKLEAQNPTYVRTLLPDLRDLIFGVFGHDTLPQCLAYLTMLENTL